MFTRILVGLDGSDHARKALGIGIRLAKCDHASLVLVRAVSDKPLSEAERKLEETEFGIRGLEERLPATAITDAIGDPRLRLSVTHEKTPDAPLLARTELAQLMLEEAREDAIKAGVAEVDLRVDVGDPARLILDVAKSEKADLIVIGSRGLSNIQGLVLGSTSYKVTHLASCSCLTVT